MHFFLFPEADFINYVILSIIIAQFFDFISYDVTQTGSVDVLVRDVGMETGVVGNVFHFLNSAVWKEDGVLTHGVIFDFLLRVGKIISAFVIRNVISAQEKSRKNPLKNI